ncbi:MAG: pyridoxal-phosphate dependent enzyme [Hymenobacteraceae bacterium]|nr:pyridoxal-phosphate dependent enzyme [Hymenobacteraceae bacterium]
MLQTTSSPLQKLEHPLLAQKQVQLYVKRDDLLHPYISGNKWRKLKYNLQAAREQQKSILLTFGGAYSNHIAAVAAAGAEFGFKTIGFIRGEEHLPLNSTLALAAKNGMQLQYLNRESYRHKNEPDFLKTLQKQYPEAYIIPEGGSNALAVKGCAEIISEITIDFDYICAACGTGGTLAGLIAGLQGQKQVLGFPALKGGEFLEADIKQLLWQYNRQQYTNWQLITDYHFGGYAKVKPELLSFMQFFKKHFKIELEPVYTGKLFFGLFDLIEKDFFATGATVVAVHTGGLQGNAGFKERLGVEV